MKDHFTLCSCRCWCTNFCYNVRILLEVKCCKVIDTLQCAIIRACASFWILGDAKKLGQNVSHNIIKLRYLYRYYFKSA